MNLRKWFSPPVYGDEDKNSLARALYTIQLALVGVFVLTILLVLLTGRYTLALIVGIGGVPLFIEIWLVRHGHVRSSGMLLLWTLLGLAVYLMYIGDGLIDIAILLFPAVIIVGSMLFTKRIFLLLNGLSLLSLTWIAYEQLIGHIATRGKQPVELFGDWAIAMLVLPITALASYILAESMRANLRRARQNEIRLGSANLSLEGEVGERLDAEEHLKKRADEMSLLYQTGVALTGDQDLYHALRALVKELRKMLMVDGFYVGIYDQQTDIISFPLWLSLEEDGEIAPYKLGDQPGLTGEVIAARKTLYLPDIQDPETQETHKIVVIRDIGVHSYLGIPLAIQDRILGVISVQARQANAYTPDQIRLLETLASQVAMVVERKLAEKQLSASEERYRLISGVISDYTFSTKIMPDGRLQLDWAAGAFEAITGYTYEEYNARGGWLAALHPDDVAKDAQDMARLRTNQPVVSEVRTIAKDGTVHWVRVYGHPVWDAEKNELVGIFGAVQDITERVQAEAEREKLIADLEAKNAELERFTYTVSHDLKSPLITIQGFLGYLEQDTTSGNTERLRTDIQRINNAAEKMQRLLSELLELSRIGRLMNPPVDIPFEALVREALALTEGRLRERGVQVEVDPDLPAVHGDPSRLVEVLQNLIDNAAKFMGDQPKPAIHIGVRSVDGQPAFFVEDNGIGIEPLYQQKVFGLFNKLDPRTEGTGVGLTLVKRIIEVHGGKIWLTSTGANSGSTIYFTLPVSK